MTRIPLLYKDMKKQLEEIIKNAKGENLEKLVALKVFIEDRLQHVNVLTAVFNNLMPKT